MKNKKTLLIGSLIAAMILPFVMLDNAEASCRQCGDENDLRIIADYQIPNWWGVDHHLSDYWTNVSVGSSGSNTITVDERKSGFTFPSFIVKTNSISSKTVSYDVSYSFKNSNGYELANGSRTYTETFSSYLDGETDRFPVMRDGVNPGDTLTVTLRVNSIS